VVKPVARRDLARQGGSTPSWFPLPPPPPFFFFFFFLETPTPMGRGAVGRLSGQRCRERFDAPGDGGGGVEPPFPPTFFFPLFFFFLFFFFHFLHAPGEELPRPCSENPPRGRSGTEVATPPSSLLFFFFFPFFPFYKTSPLSSGQDSMKILRLLETGGLFIYSPTSVVVVELFSSFFPPFS